MNIQALKIGTFAAKAKTRDGTTVLLIFNEYGESREGPSVHSKIQLIDGGCQVYDIPTALSGDQCLIAQEHVLHLIYDQGLPFVETAYPSDDDLESLPRINMTCPQIWDPSKYNDPVAAESLDSMDGNPSLHVNPFNDDPNSDDTKISPFVDITSVRLSTMTL